MLGGILDNDTALAIREHTSDTNGFTEHLFGLCVLLGITYMPRLKDLPYQVLSRVDRDADYGALQQLLRGGQLCAPVSEIGAVSAYLSCLRGPACREQPFVHSCPEHQRWTCASAGWPRQKPSRKSRLGAPIQVSAGVVVARVNTGE